MTDQKNHFIEAKIRKTLQNHDLSCLVFEKRERRTASNQSVFEESLKLNKELKSKKHTHHFSKEEKKYIEQKKVSSTIKNKIIENTKEEKFNNYEKKNIQEKNIKDIKKEKNNLKEEKEIITDILNPLRKEKKNTSIHFEEKQPKLPLELRALYQTQFLNNVIKNRRNNETIKDYNEEDSESEVYTKRKNKRIKKIDRTFNKSKNYCMNRIFRKEEKKKYLSYVLEIDLHQIDLNYLNKIGSFQIIHCSVPLDLLVELPEIKELTKSGFIFVWVERGELPLGYALLKRWGYDVVDQIMWIKCNEETILCEEENQTHIFRNCKSTCLVGYKCSPLEKTEYKTKISNNVIFAEEKFNEKPIEIYEIAELMMPNALKLEIGGNEINGWLTLKHHESLLTRCRKCFKGSNLMLVKEYSSIYSLCEKCLKHEIKENILENFEISKIINEVNINELTVCVNCNSFSEKLIKQEGVIYCEKCLEDKKLFEESEICALKKIHYLKAKAFICSECKQVPIQSYYECNKCKECHIKCENCFWTTAEFSSHQWRRKIIITETGLKCCGCSQELIVPYWVCSICINFNWCGSCVGISNKYHFHNKSHKMHLII